MPSIAERLARAKTEGFVGRESERALWRAALATGPEPPPFCVLHVYGPGGIGKSSLLRAFAADAAAAGVPAVTIDGRDTEPTPDGFARGLRAALRLDKGDDPAAFLAQPGRRAILVDTYENLLPLDGWLRETFLPRLSGDAVVVLAGRQSPAPGWMSDPGWQSLLRALPLRNLSGSEARDLLARRGVPDGLHRSALGFTHGHPLALSLVADVLTRPGGAENWLLAPGGEKASAAVAPPPDIVEALLGRFLEGVPGPAHRAALEVCAVLRVTDEAVLSEALRGDPITADIGEIFVWLRGLSFMEAAPAGLFPHDVVRDALLADLRWRNRDRYVELHRRARTYYAARLPVAPAQDQQRLLYDCIFLHRDSAVVRAAFTWQERPTAYPDALRPADVPALLAMVRAHEGDASSAAAALWLERQPDNAVVFRDPADGHGGGGAGEPVGFFHLLSLHRTNAADRAKDPGAAAAWRHLEAHAPLREGETAKHLRFWMDRDSHQMPSPVQSLIIVHALRQFLTNPRLAFTFFACAEPDLWEPVFEHAHIPRLSDADFSVGGRVYGVYGHDWRTRPASAWLEAIYEREVSAGAETGPPPRTAPPLIVLSADEFAAAVRDALKGLRRDGALLSSPLLRSRAVALAAGGPDSDPAARAAALRRLIEEAAERLQATPRLSRGYRALHRTFLEPARTQEQAADLLDLPFNTYRRHLAEGITALTEALWRAEIGDATAG